MAALGENPRAPPTSSAGTYSNGSRPGGGGRGPPRVGQLPVVAGTMPLTLRCSTERLGGPDSGPRRRPGLRVGPTPTGQGLPGRTTPSGGGADGAPPTAVAGPKGSSWQPAPPS